MNKSYSKIRHIQKLNQLLENRIISEQENSTITTGNTQSVEHYKRKFYGLMESSIGNVKPLLSEDYKPCPNEKYTVTGTKVLKTKEELKQHLIKTKPANPITIERYCNGKPVDSRYAELNSKNEVVISDETIYE